MKVADLLKSRRANWQALEKLCARLESSGGRKMAADTVARFAALYRSACADLALAEAYQLPADTVRYLHQLVGRAHNQLYRTRGFRWRSWAEELLFVLPRRLYRDNCLRLAFAVFWGLFILSMALAYFSPQFANDVLGKEFIDSLEQMYAQPIGQGSSHPHAFMAGYYVQHNAGIGLQCFAAGLLLGIGGLFATVSNAAILGAAFGYMATTSHSDNFFEFVTAHGPFELTAVVLAAGAGMRLGFSIVDTGGLSREASLRRAAREAVPAACLSITLFVLAAVIEGFVSPSALAYEAKAAVAAFSAGTLIFYFMVLGFHRPLTEDQLAAGSDDD